jgi:hypothetical protein
MCDVLVWHYDTRVQYEREFIDDLETHQAAHPGGSFGGLVGEESHVLSHLPS